VETPRKFITAVINLRGVFTNKTIIIILNINTSECWLIQSYSLLYFNILTILTLNLLKMCLIHDVKLFQTFLLE
jgi:hypothetical protein